MHISALIRTFAPVFLCVATSAAFADGAYVSDKVLVTINRPNTWFRTDFPIVGPSLPSTARINSISWKYDLGAVPAGGTLQAQICHGTTLACQDITAMKSGTTNYFQNKPATTPFFMQYRINRTSSFPPVSGRAAQVIVNWNQ